MENKQWKRDRDRYNFKQGGKDILINKRIRKIARSYLQNEVSGWRRENGKILDSIRINVYTKN